jgi:hypothetical protein
MGIAGKGAIGASIGCGNSPKNSNRGGVTGVGAAGRCANADNPTTKHNKTANATTLELIMNASLFANHTHRCADRLFGWRLLRNSPGYGIENPTSPTPSHRIFLLLAIG